MVAHFSCRSHTLSHPLSLSRPLLCSPIMASDEQKAKCPFCQRLFKPAGLGSHKKACKKRLDAAVQESQFVADLLAEPQCTFYTLVMAIRVITVSSDSLPAPKFVAPWQTNARVGQSSTDDRDPQGIDR